MYSSYLNNYYTFSDKKRLFCRVGLCGQLAECFSAVFLQTVPLFSRAKTAIKSVVLGFVQGREEKGSSLFPA